MNPLRLALLLLILTGATVRAQSLQEVRTYIVQEEGVRLTAYRDRGAYAIGVGHSTRAPLPSITQAEAERLLTVDVERAYLAALRLTPRFESQPQTVRLLIISLAFELGDTGYARFIAFRRAIDRHDYRAAACHLHHSLWARQVPGRAARCVAALNAL